MKTLHEFNNALTAVLGNVEYARQLVAGVVARNPHLASELAELAEALGDASSASDLLRARVESLAAAYVRTRRTSESECVAVVAKQ